MANHRVILQEKLKSLIVPLWYKISDSIELLQEMVNQIEANIAEVEEDLDRISDSSQARKVYFGDSTKIYQIQNILYSLERQKKLLLLTREEHTYLQMLLFDGESDEEEPEEQQNDLPDLEENDNI